MLLAIVADDELLVSQIVKSLLLLILTTGLGFNLFRLYTHRFRSRQLVSLLLVVLLTTVGYFLVNAFRIDHALLNQAVYADGVTTAYCSVFGRGEGIEFEYEWEGVRYRACSSYHPIARNTLLVPGGKFKVRLSRKFPGKGRMNFNLPG
ncbi:MAG: hypothetical protein IT266_06615 [Saprospiraceae bacterium]|nr:hypothetical protein [Saprospiraceae bacterium]